MFPAEDLRWLIILNEQIKKKRGNRLLPVPRTEAFALPDTVEQTTLEPTPNMICSLYTRRLHTFRV